MPEWLMVCRPSECARLAAAMAAAASAAACAAFCSSLPTTTTPFTVSIPQPARGKMQPSGQAGEEEDGTAVALENEERRGELDVGGQLCGVGGRFFFLCPLCNLAESKQIPRAFLQLKCTYSPHEQQR